MPRLAPASSHPTRGLQRRSPSQLEGGDHVDLAGRLRLDSTIALGRGSLIHAWFELVQWVDVRIPDEEELRRVADTMSTGDMDISVTIAEFQAALEKPEIRKALSLATYSQPSPDGGACAVFASGSAIRPQWEVRREWPFAVRDGNVLMQGTIDRLVVLHDVTGESVHPVAADIIDFKSDALAADDPIGIAQRVDHYRPQIEAYRRAVASLLDLDPKKISARLALTGPGIVRAVC